jgi:vacuolar-type H+-ATPase subunit E/Vma4
MATQYPSRDEYLKQLKDLKAEKNFDPLLACAQEAVAAYPEDKKIRHFLHYAQEHYVHEKLDSQIVEQLQEKEDYTSLTTVYQKLLTIFPESKDLQKRLKQARQKLAEAHHDQMQNYYISAEKQIREMLARRDYENASTACNEILEQEPENKVFIRLLVKAEAGLEKQMNEVLELYYKEVLPMLREEYKEHKDQFIRI